jgi:hypothetical protein
MGKRLDGKESTSRLGGPEGNAILHVAHTLEREVGPEIEKWLSARDAQIALYSAIALYFQ